MSDEFCLQLSFQKGDVITVTQAIEGGWWEGTLRGTTGWFPSNYVRDLKGSAGKLNQSQFLKVMLASLTIMITQLEELYVYGI